MTNQKNTVALVILDGFGYSEQTQYNAIKKAHSPTWDTLWQRPSKTLIGTSGLAVGLPEGQMGNSEVGHMTLGAGRVVYQNFTKINKAISDGDFFSNTTYCDAIDSAQKNNAAVHIMGLLSQGGVHSHEDHIFAIIKMAVERGAKKIYLHAILDGRDTPPRDATASLQKAQALFEQLGIGKIASVCGRYYALDRDNRWDRVEKAYTLMTHGHAEFQASSALDALNMAYARDENDEFVSPTIIAEAKNQAVTIEDNDSIIFMNFRPDRARQIAHTFVDPDFNAFERTFSSKLNTKKAPALSHFVMTTEYSATLTTKPSVSCAFPAEDLNNSFGEVLKKHNKTQLRIAETEKYAHVTFFFSGGQEELYDGEERILIPSPQVKTYDLKPEMSAPELTEKLVAAIKSQKFDAIICNYANCDMVGHTGNESAAAKAVEAIDQCLAQIVAALKEVNGDLLVTADHGNAEQMFDEESNQPHTQHTTFPVPLVYVGSKDIMLDTGGSLANVAPTMLDLLDIEKPQDMTANSLVLNLKTAVKS